MLGWTLAQQDRIDDGLVAVQHGLAAWHATGAQSFRPYFLSLLAEVYVRAGQVEQGVAAVEEAQAVMERIGERWWAAELYRLDGELRVLQDADPQVIERCFWQALTIARQQQAHMVELRAALSLCRWWQRHGKVAEAQQVLTPLVAWFTDDRESSDIQAAVQLLHELKTSDAGSGSVGNGMGR